MSYRIEKQLLKISYVFKIHSPQPILKLVDMKKKALMVTGMNWRMSYFVGRRGQISKNISPRRHVGFLERHQKIQSVFTEDPSSACRTEAIYHSTAIQKFYYDACKRRTYLLYNVCAVKQSSNIVHLNFVEQDLIGRVIMT